MSSMNSILDRWFETIMQEWSSELSPDRKPWLWSRVMFSALESASRSFIYYAEAPSKREYALVSAQAYRDFAYSFGTGETDYEQLAVTICDRNIGYMDESTVPEQPDWLTDEEWELAKHDATHDEDGKMLRPQLEGFVTGAIYDVPCKDNSEFDEDNCRKVVRAAMHQALKKAQQDSKYCNRRAAKPNTNYWKNIWCNKAYDAKMDMQYTETFIKQNNLEYED